MKASKYSNDDDKQVISASKVK